MTDCCSAGTVPRPLQYLSRVFTYDRKYCVMDTTFAAHQSRVTTEVDQLVPHVTTRPAMHDEPAVPRNTPYLHLKYIVETLIALVLLIVFSPLILLAALLVVLTSPGPAFYSQCRLGMHGRRFMVYKLRSMVQGAERTTGATWCKINDPRVTPLGRVLRETHIDELPQLVNVVLGQMSLVGPRPERPELAARLQQQLPRFGERINVRPGITGFAQLRLPQDTDVDSVRKKLAYDLYYVRNLGAWLDLRIMLLTLQLFLTSLADAVFKLMALPSREAIESQLVPLSEPIAAHGNNGEVAPPFRHERPTSLALHETQLA